MVSGFDNCAACGVATLASCGETLKVEFVAQSFEWQMASIVCTNYCCKGSRKFLRSKRIEGVGSGGRGGAWQRHLQVWPCAMWQMQQFCSCCCHLPLATRCCCCCCEKFFFAQVLQTFSTFQVLQFLRLPSPHSLPAHT